MGRPADQRIAEAMRLLREIATHHDMEFASLVVRGDGRGEIEVSDSRRGFKRVVKLDMDPDTGAVSELPLFAYPRDRSVPDADFHCPLCDNDAQVGHACPSDTP